MKLFFSVRQKIPWGIKIAVRKFLFFGLSNYCNCCRSYIRKFFPGGKDTEVVNKYAIVGAGYHVNDICPVCHAGYRQRLLAIYIYKNIPKKQPVKLLHLAPEQALYFKLSSYKNISYRYGDLCPSRYAYYCKNPETVDLTAINFPDNSFDIAIVSHILEHIPDDKKAIGEVYRVLKPQGWAIMQVPISWDMEQTIEHKNKSSEEERLKCYGQKDHVRIYGADYIERLEKAGFTIELFQPDRYNEKWGLDKSEKLIIGHKK